MALTQINNGDTGLVARNAINAAIAQVDELRVTATVSTTNGATTSIASIDMTGYNTFSIEGIVSAYDTANQYSYGSQIFGVFKNDGLTVTQVSTTDVYEKSNFSTATSHIVVSGGSPTIVVVGETSKTIDWKVNYTITKI